MRGVENNMSGVPIFPTGIIKTYNSPTKFSEEFEPKNFSVKKYGGSNKWRSEKFNNVMLHKSLNGLHEWVKSCIDDYLTNELRMKYDEHFISESWLNVNLKGGSQPVHSHPNSIISGTYYIKADKGHPPLEFHRTRPSDTHPFISLSEQYTGQHPNTATSIAFPALQDTMIVWQSPLYHAHGPIQIDEQRISLSWNALVNFAPPSEKDSEDFYRSYTYRIKFVKEDTQ